MPKAISLFSGCGGSDAGLLAAGFNVVMANDILPYAKDVYLANHPETDYVFGDIQKVKNFPDAELLVGCYPCQGFSQGGARDPSRKINTLYLEFARALWHIKPKAFVVENVSGMIRANFRHLLDDQFKVFSEAGYQVKMQVLNAADYGVPQDRRRIFIVGLRNDLGVEFEFPVPTHGKRRAFPLTTIKDTLANRPDWPEGEFYDLDFHWYYLSRNRRRNWDEVSKTIVANPRHMPLHPISPPLIKIENNVWRFVSGQRARRFSYREAAHLQGFKRDLFFPDTPDGSLKSRYTVVGNAVPPALLKAVAKASPPVWG